MESLIIAPPIGGVLYTQLGFRAPFICGICVSVVDLLLRVLVVEPTVHADGSVTSQQSLDTAVEDLDATDGHMNRTHGTTEDQTHHESQQEKRQSTNTGTNAINSPEHGGTLKPTSSFQVLKKLSTSSRALVASSNVLLYG